MSWTAACDDVAAQLGPEDELLIIHDSKDDPVVDRKPLSENVQFIPAGDPVGCSGKANAIAAGMEAANHDRLVWTDDDFHHPPDWLDRLHKDYAEYGPTTELPAFVGQDPLAVLLEPVYVLGGTLGHTWVTTPGAGLSYLTEVLLTRKGSFRTSPPSAMVSSDTSSESYVNSV